MQSQSSKLLSAMREEIRAREIELVSATNGELLTAKAARLSRPQILVKKRFLCAGPLHLHRPAGLNRIRVRLFVSFDVNIR